MADAKTEETDVLFRVTRPRTTIFHPDRAVSLNPIQTGGEIMLPKAVADYHVRNGVGEIVTEEAEAETPVVETPAETPAPKRGPGRPAKAAA